MHSTHDNPTHPNCHNAGLDPRGRGCQVLTIGLLLLAMCLSLSATPAFAARNHSFQREFGSKGTAAGQLELKEPVEEFEASGGDEKGGSGLAVGDASHDVYVADTGNHRIDVFHANGEFVRAFGYGVRNGETELQTCTTTCQTGIKGTAPGQLDEPLFIAVDNAPGGEENIYVGDTGDNLITKYTPTGELINTWGNNGTGETPNGQLNGPPGVPFTKLYGVAVAPSSGLVWVDAINEIYQTMFQFEQATGSYTSLTFPAESEPSGITINNQEEIYVADGEPDVRKFSPAGTEIGELFRSSPNVTGLAVDTQGEAVYLDEQGSVAVVAGDCPPPDNKCSVAERFGAPELVGGAGIGVDPETSAVFVAGTSTSVVYAYQLEPVAPPVVLGGNSSDVTATSATLDGEVNPQSLPAEPETEYYFQYGACVTPSTCSSSPWEARTPTGQIPASFDTTAVSGEIAGLTAGRSYHYRLVAENKESREQGRPTVGAEHVFKTESAGEFRLPDNREWELVSPPEKFGALIEPINQEGVIMAAADGGAITYHADQPIEKAPEGAINEVQAVATRTPTGWENIDIEPSHGISGKPEGEGEPYRFFSENLQYALLQPAGAFEPLLSSEATEQTPYLRTVYDEGNRSKPCIPSPSVDCYQPMVTPADTSSGTTYGEANSGGGVFGYCPQATIFCGPILLGASENGEHSVFASYAQLTSTVTPSRPQEELYEWSHGKISIVSELPEGKGPAAGTHIGLGSGPAISSDLNVRHAVSEDGSRVIWSAEGVIYLRDTSTETTTEIAGGEFQLANKEATQILYTGGGDLFQYTVGAVEPVKRLTSGAGIKGTIIGANGDDSYIYFVGSGVLGGAASEGAIIGAPNLYVDHDGTIKLIAVLSGEDDPDWSQDSQELLFETARVSPNGQYVAFMSDADIAGYGPIDAVSGHPDEEVYLYNAETGHLACASCEPTGGRPHGVEYTREENGVSIHGLPLTGGHNVWEPSTWLAANVPAWTPYKLQEAAYQSRYLSDTGRLFFNTMDPLVSKDTNGTWDVYEYEPGGAGPEHAACGPEAADGSEVYKPSRTYTTSGIEGEEPAGCVALISSGSSSEESAFLDASETGSDVFFLTSAKLSPEDTDRAYDIYDAHECTTLSPCITQAGETENAECASEAGCRTPPAPGPSIFGPPASSTFTGEGNPTPTKPETNTQKLTNALKACRKKYPKSKKRRQACEHTAHKKYPTKAKKAAHHTKK
jgi:hypothetical protein